ncbi:MAG TPA: hypothetical protein VHX13_11495 [Acidobacteriaceae bacterium]|jgi:hypothetical protein|nr:hypothetical protein [Acidobacteriaceae bacterium]
MQPNRLGRLLGIGTRVAVGKLRDGTTQAAAAAQRSSAASATAGTTPIPSATGPAARFPDYAESSRRVARGAGRFGSALVRPFAHATGVLTLQITGVFFAIFTLFFSLHAWQAFKALGVRDRHVLVYAALALLFAWFTVTSFWRARAKQKRS